MGKTVDANDGIKGTTAGHIADTIMAELAGGYGQVGGVWFGPIEAVDAAPEEDSQEPQAVFLMATGEGVFRVEVTPGSRLARQTEHLDNEVAQIVDSVWATFQRTREHWYQFTRLKDAFEKGTKKRPDYIKARVWSGLLQLVETEATANNWGRQGPNRTMAK